MYINILVFFFSQPFHYKIILYACITVVVHRYIQYNIHVFIIESWSRFKRDRNYRVILISNSSAITAVGHSVYNNNIIQEWEVESHHRRCSTTRAVHVYTVFNKHMHGEGIQGNCSDTMWVHSLSIHHVQYFIVSILLLLSYIPYYTPRSTNYAIRHFLFTSTILHIYYTFGVHHPHLLYYVTHDLRGVFFFFLFFSTRNHDAR